MTDPVRVLIVDDDALVRAGLTMMLDGAEGLAVVGEVGDGKDVAAAVDAHAPHVVLMDIRMPQVNGIVATRRLRGGSNPPEVVVMTTFDTDENVLRALRAGASGFLVKDSRPAEIVEAIHRVAVGDPILSPHITRRLMERAAADASSYEKARATLARLTPRERDVVLAIGGGLSNAEISTQLYMSVATVKAHISRVLTKLDLSNRTQLALLVHDADLT